MSDTAGASDPNQGFPNPAVNPDLVDHDAQLAEQAEASRKAAEAEAAGSTETPPANPAGTEQAAY